VIIKLGLLMFFVALCLSFVAKGNSRAWMARVFLGGLCLLLIGVLLKLIFRL
jgi:hypothetical protein